MENTGISLKERIYRDLKQEIITAQIPPGAMILEGSLADRFGVSKTPVREALGLLQRDGFVESLHGRGYQIAPISLQDVLETLELRIVIERGTAELAAKRISKEELEALREVVESSSRFEKEGDLTAFPRLNRRYHELIAGAAKNRLLFEATIQVLDRMERVIHLDVAQVRRPVSTAHQEHVMLLQYLESGETVKARECMETHVRNAKESILRAL
jgi:DNA-binding GntR family transcriptional regulator